MPPTRRRSKRISAARKYRKGDAEIPSDMDLFFLEIDILFPAELGREGRKDAHTKVVEDMRRELGRAAMADRVGEGVSDLAKEDCGESEQSGSSSGEINDARPHAFPNELTPVQWESFLMNCTTSQVSLSAHTRGGLSEARLGGNSEVPSGRHRGRASEQIPSKMAAKVSQSDAPCLAIPQPNFWNDVQPQPLETGEDIEIFGLPPL
ncbi:hypothetical protein BC830DRAFT_1145841 [Chytriomyces sp. MP71]|nr:hypothetical protein BC830DRAFT_1145841 [Chytriomyces sp. MP71]